MIGEKQHDYSNLKHEDMANRYSFSLHFPPIWGKVV